MSAPNPIAILEVGTTRTVCLVGRATPDGPMAVVGVGVCPTTGVRKGEVTELNYAVSSVRSAVEAASKSARCDIRSAWVVYSGGNTMCTPAIGRIVLPSRSPTVDAAMLEEVRALARETVLPDNRTLLHPIVRNYVLDESRVVHNPEGLPARQLQVNMLLVHTASQNAEAMYSAVEDAQVEVNNCMFSALCASVATLTPEQKRAGVLLVNLGGGTTTYLAYADESIATAGSFAVGGDHITSDLVQAFHLSSAKTADWLKINQGSATLDGSAPTERATIPANTTLGATERSFSLRALHTVINARLDEVFRILRTLMDQQDILSKFGAGVILTGGGAYQRGATQLASRIFECPCAIAAMPPLGPAKDEQPAAFAAAYGALLLAARDLAEEEERRPRRFLDIFKRGRAP
jgi:cell division protein FtsA